MWWGGNLYYVQYILNRIYKFKSFVYGNVKLIGSNSNPSIEVEIKASKSGKAECGGCGYRASSFYDRQAQRRYELVPLWGSSRASTLVGTETYCDNTI